MSPSQLPRTRLRTTQTGSAILVHAEGVAEGPVLELVQWCAAERDSTVVAVDLPPTSPPEVLEDVLGVLAARPGMLRLIPTRQGNDSTLVYGSWLAERLGRPVLAHQGNATAVAGGGLYIPPDENRTPGWWCFAPGAAPTPYSRRFPRPSWECDSFTQPGELGPGATLELLPAGVWIRHSADSAHAPAVADFRGRLVRDVTADLMLPKVVLGYPGSQIPPIAAVAKFWRSLPGMLRPAVRFSGFEWVDDTSAPFGQQLADALDAPVVMSNGIRLTGPAARGRYELRTVLEQGFMTWTPYVGDLGYLPARSTGGIAADPVPIGPRPPIAGLAEREPGVYEYGEDAVVEVTQSGLWMRPHALPVHGSRVRAASADPKHVKVVFDASDPATADRMRSLAGEMVGKLEPRMRDAARIFAATATGIVPVQFEVPASTPPRDAISAPPVQSGASAPSVRAATSAPSGRALAAARTPAADQVNPSAPASIQAAAPGDPAGGLASVYHLLTSPRTGEREATLAPADAYRPPRTGRPGTDSVAGVDDESGSARPGSAPVWRPRAADPSEGAPVASPDDPTTAEFTDDFPDLIGGQTLVLPRRERGEALDDAIAAAVNTAGPAPRQPYNVASPNEPIEYAAFRLVSTGTNFPVNAPEAPAPSAPGATYPAAAESEPQVARSPRPVTPPPVAQPPAMATSSAVPAPETRSGSGSPVPPSADARALPARTPSADVQEPPLSGDVQAPSVWSPSAVDPSARPRTEVPVRPPAAPPVPEDVPREAPENQPSANFRADRPGFDVPERSAASAPPRAQRAVSSRVHVQPVPTAQTGAMPREEGVHKEREWLRRNMSRQYDVTASSVARILSEHPGLRGGNKDAESDVLTDLVALRLYLSQQLTGLDAAVRAAKNGPHVPVARCVAAGLRRMPSYRGPLRMSTTLTADQVQWYSECGVVTEWSFLPALVSAGFALPGSADVLIWSMSARRTGLVDASLPDQAVFLPDTSFKVLSVKPGARPEIRLRELARTEVATGGSVGGTPALDDFAVAALDEAGEAWRRADPAEQLPAGRERWFASPPGLLVQRTVAGGAGSAQKGGKA